MPKIGNKQDHVTRHVLPNGFKKMLIANEQDVELLLMNNRIYCGEIAHNISSGKRYVPPPAAHAPPPQTQNRPESQGTQRQTHQRSSQGQEGVRRVTRTALSHSDCAALASA
eukprot:CAMPEP_0168625438 /NCGR_PEP_ID=MMETSP0449_2-20121227/10005_1 /TAXON_ID=1082188 /ORGANISM="Strombidium rassoulzadegani, Strain ras09" /LENGTH=111 /DNA_ID=CAMNT_0008667179 /DNA_START=221 /DNA_END=556 /DNA_ORIENTATION=-